MDKDNTINDSTASNIKTDINNTTKEINQRGTEIQYNSNLENEAYMLTRRAENKLNPGCCLDALFSSKSKRYEDACELYKKAGEKYKVCQQWRKAGDCFERCGQIKAKLKENPTKFYQESFFCYSNGNADNDAKKTFEKMNQYLERDGEFYQVGKNYENLSKKLENNEQYDEALSYYMKSYAYYEQDGKHESLKNNIGLKIAELMLIQNHPDAPTKVPALLENIGNSCLKNPVTKYSAKDYFGKAVLTAIYYSNNPSEGSIYINKYKEIDKTFDESTIYNLCCDVINSMENNNINKLKYSIQKYKEITEPDAFMIDILNKLEQKASNNIGGVNGNNGGFEEDLK